MNPLTKKQNLKKMIFQAMVLYLETNTNLNIFVQARVLSKIDIKRSKKSCKIGTHLMISTKTQNQQEQETCVKDNVKNCKSYDPYNGDCTQCQIYSMRNVAFLPDIGTNKCQVFSAFHSIFIFLFFIVIFLSFYLVLVQSMKCCCLPSSADQFSQNRNERAPLKKAYEELEI